jgi:hypothetical protein
MLRILALARLLNELAGLTQSVGYRLQARGRGSSEAIDHPLDVRQSYAEEVAELVAFLVRQLHGY